MRIHPVTVAPNLPEALRPLQEIAMNLWFSWNWDAVELFIRLAPTEWEAARQNPVALLGRVPRARLEEMAADESYVAMIEQVYGRFQEYLAAPGWYAREFPDVDNALVAYFSCEFGLAESLPVYSGGLGVLSGDHLKTASNLQVPLVGVGLLYRQGYFQQELSADGWQQEHYPENDWHTMPVEVAQREDGAPVRFRMNIGEHSVHVQVWQVNVGRVPLYLLDTNLPENAETDREITMQLYGGDREMRLRQEILLGIGGCRALGELGCTPTVYHCNEGHSVFFVLERLRRLREAGLTLDEAREVVWASTVFTTHTPVPEGNERFEPRLLHAYLADTVADVGWTWDAFLALGREDPSDAHEFFCLTVFALRLAAYCNGVSALHGATSRRLWGGLWPRLPEKEVPITHITNGIHTPSWLSHEMTELFTRYFGPRFKREPSRFELWEGVDRIPDAELWRTHERRRERLVFFARKLLRQQLSRTGASKLALLQAEEILDPDVCTIGFARRFATYKRGTMLFTDPDRLRRLVGNPDRPVQFIFAGKAHPQDGAGKELIKHIVHNSWDEQLASRVIFLENYDINLARYLVQGCDVWMNTPRRPHEASGTSGMKAAANGVLNASTLDGWWCEGYAPDHGWAVGTGEEYGDEPEGDLIEAAALYNLIEHEILPLFYDRDGTDLPREWIARMKTVIRNLGPQFSAHRMLKEYTTAFYQPAHEFCMRLSADDYARARALAKWQRTAVAEWERVTIVGLGVRQPAEGLVAADTLVVEVTIDYGALSADDMAVEVLFGRLDAEDQFLDPDVVPATLVPGETPDKHGVYRAECLCEWSGRYGFAARVRGHHEDLVHPFHSGMITWERE